MRNWKYKLHNIQKKTMRIMASAACVLGVLAVCLGVVGYRNNLKADQTLPVVTRGVIDKSYQIPETKRKMYEEGKKTTDYSSDSMKLGNEDNPFVVVEIVPYEEYAEFGYQISGCEPTDVEAMRFSGDGITTVASVNHASVSKVNAHFFQDETEWKKYGTYMKQETNAEAREAEYIGYYEKVEKGTGTFSQKSDDEGKWTFVRDGDDKDIIWHTINASEEASYEGIEFNEDTNQKLEEIGSRIYTKRKSVGDGGKDNIYVAENYYEYQNPDYFLKESLKLSQEEADRYSIVIKTITPKELNENPEWVTYADLFVVSAKRHDTSLTDIWKNHNRLSHKSSVTSYTDGFESKNTNDNRDITWDVALKMYKKINADYNYAPIVMDSGTYHKDMFLQNKKTVKLHIYDWNLKDTGETYDAPDSYNNNMYKLAIMMFSMDAKLFEKLYLSGDDPLIQDGVFSLQEGDAQTYWNQFTFLPTGADGVGTDSWYKYWTDMDKWKDYGTAGEVTTTPNQEYVNGRLYVFAGDNSITSSFGTGSVSAADESSKFYDFKDFLKEEDKTDATPADAVRYILGYNKSDSYIEGSLKVLDLEPCYDSKNGYSLKESYIRLMVPKFVGDITITHMTMAEFIGSAEDLNSTYNMIFIGTDVGAYNLDSDGKTVWNDTTMNGKIYFHTGDQMKATEWSGEDTGKRSRSVKFIEKSDGNTIDSNVLRFPGNDITKLKKTELESFLSAGYPIVAMPVVYNTDTTAIDQHSNLCDFITTKKGDGTTLCSRDDLEKIQDVLRTSRSNVTFEELPKLYDGSTEGETSTKISNPNYLDRDSKERSLLKFKFTVADTDTNNTYGCRIYLDQNQDGKFDSTELYYDEDEFTPGERKVTVRLARAYSGIVQWKIEVYQTKNSNVRFVQTGCSAASNITKVKKKIRVLQIMPKDPNPFVHYFDDATMKYVDKPYAGYLNLGGKLYDNENTDLFKKYYSSLDDYEITVYTVKVEQEDKNGDQPYKLSHYFNSSNKFVYDESKPISDSNPSSSNYTPVQQKLFNDYDMIIVGFGDTYGGVNISNKYGAVDFIKYFIASGKSVLFTHDLTSLHNTGSEDFGYSANTLLRDTMGMNRYMAVNDNLSDSEKTKLKNYQAKNEDKYDSVKDVEGNSLDQKQGYTYYAMKRLGWKRDANRNNDSDFFNQKMPYRYLIKNKKNAAICGGSDLSINTGFNNNNDLTTKVTKTNTGQITEYPYKIGSIQENQFTDTSFTVASTHAQWYQLNMEDPEVTVWYCLADDNKCIAWNDKIGDSKSGDSNNPGTAATYGVSPNDAANNYYIYSKGNVFYSGVGHSTVTGDMEAKLFINTMIAAYRASYEAPMVEILNESATLTSSNNSDLSYEMTAMTEYGSGDIAEVDNIEFSPVELNAITTTLSCSIKYDNGSYVQTIYKKGSSTPINAVEKNGVWVFEGVKNMKDYYFKYEGSNTGNIHFEIWNDKVDKKGKTDLTINTQNLFLLD